jgi:hypothetical protein
LQAHAVAIPASALAPKQVGARGGIAGYGSQVQPGKRAHEAYNLPDFIFFQRSTKTGHHVAPARHDLLQIGVAVSDGKDAPRQIRPTAAFAFGAMTRGTVSLEQFRARRHCLRIVTERIIHFGADVWLVLSQSRAREQEKH